MKLFKRSLVAFAAMLLVAMPMVAQATLGNLTGTVIMDNAPLPGVTVTISSPALQGTRVAYTDVNGNYNFVALPPGDYTVNFTMESMQPVTSTTRVSLGGTARANATMRMSAVAESITVTAAAPAVLETTEVQTNLQSDLIDELPIGRTIQATITLAPGVTNNGPGGALVIGGGYAYDSLYVINGAVTNENLRGQTDDLFIEDAIQETTVMTGAISAEFGRFTGGVVSAITKSGGNEFTGSFRDSLTNPAWDETSAYGETQQDSKLNQTFEATLGGRIIRDRLWFFLAGRQAETDTPGFYINGGALDSPVARPSTVATDERYEVKLTGQLTPRHTLVGSYMSYEVNQTPYCFVGCWEPSNLDVNGRDLPREMITANYNGLLSDNFVLQAAYSERSLEFVGSGGEHVTTDFDDPLDIALGTWAYDYGSGSGGFWGAPVFCGICDAESRSNEAYSVKGTYYLATGALGTHNIVAGYENFTESLFSNNYQSGSNFGVYAYTAPEYSADGQFRPVLSPNDIIRYSPINTLSQGSNFNTDSIFINDKWDLTQRWSFNLGLRYDRNDGADSAGAQISDDSNFSPRLGLTFDVFGDGRLRANASFSRYVSRIQEGIGGAQGGGNPAAFFYLYDGPQIGGANTNLGSVDVFEQFFTYFLANGGTENTDNLIGVSIPGLNTRFEGSLKSPNVDEFTVGLGMQVGTRGFVRADYIDRTWGDFYHVYTVPGDQVENPFSGQFLDFNITGNTNDLLERTYKAIQTQGSYRLLDRLNLGASYTWSEARGNEIGETSGSGPVASAPGSYAEYKAFAQNNPVGFLPNDQTHRLRAWLSYDQPLGFLGDLNVSVLERFDSGTPYSAFGNVSTASMFTAENAPDYAVPPSTVGYFFSDRGEFRSDDITATDLALNWTLPITRVNVFIQGEMINVFNEQNVITPNAGVTVLTTNPFDPRTTTPSQCTDSAMTNKQCIEAGHHYRLGANFGKPTAAASYQLPRTWRFSAGIRF